MEAEKKTADGSVVQVVGPVVDVRFPAEALPQMREAVEIEVAHEGESRRLVLEVAQHLGNETVRCVAMSPTEGLVRGMAVRNTGKPIMVPVGTGVLGRMFNVLGEEIDGLGPVEAADEFAIHRPAPSFDEQEVRTEIFETGFKVVDLLAPYARGGKVGLFGGAGVGKTVLLTELIHNMATHSFVPGHAAAKKQGLGQRGSPQDGIGNIFGQPVAQPIANGFQTMPFLLGVNQVGLGKNGTAGCDAGPWRPVGKGQPTDFGRTFQAEAPRLLIQKGAGAGRAGGTAATAEVTAVGPQPDQLKFFAPHVEDGPHVRKGIARGRNTTDLVIDSRGGPHGAWRRSAGRHPERLRQIETA